MTSTAPTSRKAAFGNSVRDWAAIVLGITIYAIGFTVFILPHHVVIGGMAGFSTLIYYATGGLLPVAAVMYGTNILLLICGYKYLGRGFVLRTIFGTTLLSLLIGLVEGYFTSHPPIVSSAPMSIILGGVLLGLGIGIYYSHHGTTGGTDIVAAIMSHVSNVSMGRVMMIIDVSIVAFSFFLPFDGDMEARVQARTQTIIFGLLAIVIYSLLADKYIAQGKQTIQFIILSEKWNDVAYRITHETGRGATIWDAQGYWTGDEKKLMLVWCREVDTYNIYRIVHEVDPNAYVTTSTVRNVYGNGFDRLKIKKKQPHRQSDKAN
ncbi:YitT family protein [uncultured Duncaniella sp.]|uniref:YitT family protein n=1 Tax=uncultured Duncaniella sp. TaxID=2768039 RepID=UPI0026120743|nr:YitT family protein [uncultured Duncaniella sp.]